MIQERARLCATIAAILALGAGCEERGDQTKEAGLPNWQATASGTPTGPRYEDEDFTLEVRPARRCAVRTPLSPAAGRTRISVPVEVQARTTRPVPVNPMDFTLEDKEGHEYRPTLAGCAPVLKPTSLKSGASVEAEIAFDVPVNAERFELSFEPFLIGRPSIDARAIVVVNGSAEQAPVGEAPLDTKL